MKFDTLRRWTLVLPIAAVVTAITIFGYQTATAQQAAVKAELPPAQPPEHTVGDKSIWRDKDGKETTYEITGVDGDTVSGRGSGGCSWKVPAGGGFGPSLEWKNCGGGSGTHTLEKPDTTVYPLQVGNAWRWKFRGRNNKGRRWSGVRKCKVKGTSNVSVPAGNFDTYHVVCTDKWTRREWHYSPELRRSVTHRRKSSGWSSYEELVSFTLAK